MRAATWRVAPAIGLAALLASPAPGDAHRPETVRFCVSIDNLPLAEAHPPSGIEVEFARALAARVGGQARFHWLGLQDEPPDQALLEGRCDAALGAVVDPGPLADARVAPGLALTEPYYGAGYLLVRRANAPPIRRLAELANTRIGVETESVAIYSLKQRGHSVHALDDYHAVVRAVGEGRVDYGYLWGPLAAWLLRDGQDVVVDERFEPEERWNFALAVRGEDEVLRERLNVAIRKLRAAGIVAEIFGDYRVPYLAPSR